MRPTSILEKSVLTQAPSSDPSTPIGITNDPFELAVPAMILAEITDTPGK
jgi:hypothetical protein